MESFSQWLAANLWAEHLAEFIILYSGVMILTRSIREQSRAWRVRRLMRRYNDPAAVQRILNHVPWDGETLEQIRMSFGRWLRIQTKIQNGRPVKILNIFRAKNEKYVVALEEDRVISWQLIKS